MKTIQLKLLKASILIPITGTSMKSLVPLLNLKLNKDQVTNKDQFTWKEKLKCSHILYLLIFTSNMSNVNPPLPPPPAPQPQTGAGVQGTQAPRPGTPAPGALAPAPAPGTFPLPPPIPPIPPTPVVFSLVPADTTGILDYTSCQGIEIYKAATRSLYEDPSDNFHVDAPGLQTFLGLLQNRGKESKWDFDIPQDLSHPLANLQSLLNFHGRFTLEHIQAFCRTCVNTCSWATQENMQIVKCILTSLSLTSFRKVQVWHAQWHIESATLAPF